MYAYIYSYMYTYAHPYIFMMYRWAFSSIEFDINLESTLT